MAAILVASLLAPAQAALVEINAGTDWRATGVAPAAAWTSSPGFDDSGWGLATVSSMAGGMVHIWTAGGEATSYIRHEFDLSGSIVSGLLTGGIDDDVIIWINGTEVLRDLNGSANNYSVNIGAYLVAGRNLIAAQAIDRGGGRGFRANIAIETATAAVPEPASWALMIGGFGLAGSALRRTRNRRLSFT